MLAAYDVMRQKRNDLSYEVAQTITRTDVDKAIKQAGHLLDAIQCSLDEILKP